MRYDIKNIGQFLKHQTEMDGQDRIYIFNGEELVVAKRLGTNARQLREMYFASLPQLVSWLEANCD